MGLYLSYLSEPITEKVSSDEANEKLVVGSSSMQGWRENQEDSHNCILEYDKNTSLFAVYDGHGGHEVAVYTSQMLPEFIKETEAYKSGNIEKALIDAFLNFDATLISPEVIDKLKKIAAEKLEAEEIDDDDDDEENVSHLYEEASMPIEQVIEKYTSKLLKTKKKSLKVVQVEKEKASSSSKSSSEVSPSSTSSKDNVDEAISNKCEVTSSICEKNTETSANTVSSTSEDNQDLAEANSVNENVCIKADSSAEEGEKEITDSEAIVKSSQIQNGDISPNKGKKSAEDVEKVDSSSPQENGFLSTKGKGKAIVKKQPIGDSGRPKRTATHLYNKLLTDSVSSESDDDDDDDDEEDKTFTGPADSSDDDDNDVVNSTVETEDCSESEDEEQDEEDDGDEEDLDEEEEDEESMEFQKNMKDEPGSGSGCTAVVALLRENRLFVANAGDSRCIVCRNGKAVEMSFDHKPEDQPEEERIKKAGGKVTADGRVNGGLNLSRALGDHAYKQNKELSDREQMITALPDIKTLTINPGQDEFMVLACDGIWNSMTNQEVVDFIRSRIEKGETRMSRICEAMFDSCLAPNTMNDGTGCDNMTAIIVQFKNSSKKRTAPEDDIQSTESTKRAKTDTEGECAPSM
ncbi:probable protein phosphatase CG10417 isoform X2 [Agrilus planipennis]|uniref:protein-serine/threonine phosphatase n=1 Tax=Agrilus planipennis TaxID=224129 RepID=A0A1W4X003_AGRPL|nr:probable protein phosphatase CG10417 isoform X2 [Agrilus planipennis]